MNSDVMCCYMMHRLVFVVCCPLSVVCCLLSVGHHGFSLDRESHKENITAVNIPNFFHRRIKYGSISIGVCSLAKRLGSVIAI